MTLASNPLVSTALPAPEGYYLDRSLAVKLDRLSASEISAWGIDAEEEIKPLLYPNRGADLAQIAALTARSTNSRSTSRNAESSPTRCPKTQRQKKSKPPRKGWRGSSKAA